MCANLALVTAHPQKDNADRVRPLESETESEGVRSEVKYTPSAHMKQTNIFLMRVIGSGVEMVNNYKKALVFRLSYLFDFACDSHRI